MNVPNFSSCQIEEVIQFASAANPRQIETHASQMTHEQIVVFIEAINEKNCSTWKESTRATVIGLNERPQLEVVGDTMTAPQFIELINSCLQVEDKHHWKLSPLFVGMNHDIFSETLELLSSQQLQVFKDEGVTEPVQHHLTTLTHRIENEIEKTEKIINQLYEKIDQFKPEQIGLHDVRGVIKEIELHQDFFENLFKTSNKALAIAWNTKRLDLIESLNCIKASCHKCVRYGLGIPSNDQQPASGLYLLLEEKLLKVYGNSLDPNDTEAVRDLEPAVEGLVKISVWYLRDYWDLGLLPHIKDKKALDLELNTHSEIERVQYREELFSKAQHSLTALGLSTVKDLKNHYIFSRKALQEYLQEKISTTAKSS